jgi:protein gp37
MKDTSIIWTDHTWNFFRARAKETGKKGWLCEKVSRGCNHCYAEAINKRFGNQLEYNKLSADQVELYLADPKEPAKYEQPSFVFVNSMTDTFWDAYPDKFRHLLFDRIEEYPQHEFQLLTKRPREMVRFSKKRKFPKNAWAGVTIEEESQMPRMDILRDVNADIRWVSMEPLIGHVSWMYLEKIDWIVTGGESGSHLWNPVEQDKRGMVTYDKATKKWSPKPESVEMVENIYYNCNEFATAFLHKQWGGALPGSAGRLVNGKEYNGFPEMHSDGTLIRRGN